MGRDKLLRREKMLIYFLGSDTVGKRYRQGMFECREEQTGNTEGKKHKIY